MPVQQQKNKVQLKCCCSKISDREIRHNPGHNLISDSYADTHSSCITSQQITGISIGADKTLAVHPWDTKQA